VDIDPISVPIIAFDVSSAIVNLFAVADDNGFLKFMRKLSRKRATIARRGGQGMLSLCEWQIRTVRQSLIAIQKRMVAGIYHTKDIDGE
jgi:hypothetical protein